MMPSLLWWVSLLVLLVGLSIWLYNGFLVRLMHLRLRPEVYDWRSWRSRLMQRLGKLLVQTSIIAISMVCGYAVRDLWQFHHTYVLNDLTVVHKVSESEWVLMFNENHTSFTTKFCDDYLPQFQEGTRIKIMVYEDRGTCWSVSNKKLGYIVDRKEGT